MQNFIYFIADELRADALGCYGNGFCQTPNFDRLAANGTRFANCSVQHTVCTPSRSSFLTGWYPHVRGHRSLWHTLGIDEPNLLRTMKEAGFQVHVTGKNDALTPDAAKVSITTLHRAQTRELTGATRPEPRDPHYRSFLYGPMTADHPDVEDIETCIGFLERWKPGDPPFFFYLALLLPHPPYTCPEPWYSRYLEADIPLSPPLADGPDFHAAIRQYRQLEGLEPGELRRIKAVYHGMVSYLDHQLGRLLDALERTGLADTTNVVAFSDHGDWAGDYGLVEKWPAGVDDKLTQVPLIFSGPDIARGRVVQAPVELLDLPVTTTALAGLALDYVQFGRSLVPQLGGEAGDMERATFTEGGYDPHEPQIFEGKPGHYGDIAQAQHIYGQKGRLQQDQPRSVGRCVAMRTLHHKLVWRTTGEHELYDLAADPDERANRYDDPGLADVQTKLTQRLLDWLVRTSDVPLGPPQPRQWPDDLS